MVAGEDRGDKQTLGPFVAVNYRGGLRVLAYFFPVRASKEGKSLKLI